MTWLDDILDSLSHKDRWGYRLGELPAAEPLALAALALLGHDRHAEAKPLLEKLCELQAGTGALGIFQGMGDPHWGTAHAILAWSAALNSTKLDSSLRDRLPLFHGSTRGGNASASARI
ncbi:MAG: hypothetical protein K8U03_25555 [Planctomycetia bacterium]|nr:hypothetical protein [Planctomycetia bacterium]